MIYFTEYFVKSQLCRKYLHKTMKQKLFCFLFLFLQYTYAQSPAGIDLLKNEHQIKRTLYSQPDSAKVYIKQVLNYKGKLHDTIYTNMYIGYGIYHHLKNNTDSSLYYFNKAFSFSNEQKYPKQYARLLRNKAAAYKKRADYDEALKILNLAEEKYRSINDLEGIAIVYGDIASNYNLMLKSEDAIRYLLKSIAILEKKNDKFYIHNVKLSLANTYMNTGNNEFAADIYKEVLKGFQGQGSNKNYALALLNYGDCLARMKKYNEAKKNISEAINKLEKFNDQDILAIGYSKLGIIETELNNLVSAELFHQIAFQKASEINSPRIVVIASDYIKMLNLRHKYKEAIQIINDVEKFAVKEKANINDKIYFESQKNITYQNNNDRDKALAALKTKLELMDTLKKADQPICTIALQQEYQNKYQNRKRKSLKNLNASLKEKLSQSKKAAMIPIASLSCILLGVAVVCIRKNKKHKKKILHAKSCKDQLLSEYEHKKELNRIHKESINQKLDELISNTSILATIEGNIDSLVNLCKEQPENIAVENVKSQLRSLISDKDYWTLFRKRFNEANHNFQKNLQIKFPQLTENDLFFCSLLKLKLPNKDMGMLMQVSPESIVKKKYRIKQRMQITTEQELENILSGTPQ